MKNFILENLVNVEMFDLIAIIFCAFLLLNISYLFLRRTMSYRTFVFSILTCLAGYSFYGTLIVIAILDSNQNLVIPLTLSLIIQFGAFLFTIIDFYKNKE